MCLCIAEEVRLLQRVRAFAESARYLWVRKSELSASHRACMRHQVNFIHIRRLSPAIRESDVCASFFPGVCSLLPLVLEENMRTYLKGAHWIWMAWCIIMRINKYIIFIVIKVHIKINRVKLNELFISHCMRVSWMRCAVARAICL